MLRSRLDVAGRSLVAGWAFDPDDGDAPVRLSIVADGTVLATVVADQYRADLEANNIGDGYHGFAFVPVPPLPPGGLVLHVRRQEDGQELEGSPAVLAAETVADALQGSLDEVSREGVRGWVRGTLHPDVPVSLLIGVNEEPPIRVLANTYRADLEAAGIGRGRHAFEVRLGGLSILGPCTVRVQREADGAHLPGSPVVLDAVTGLGPGTRASLAGFLGDVNTDAALVERLDFLAEQTERLLQLRADRLGRRVDRDKLRQVRWRRPEGEAEPAGPGAARRALVIDDRLPVAERDAGSNAILSHLRSLIRLGHEVGFAPADMRASGQDTLAALDVTAYAAPWTGSVEEVLRRQAGCFDLVYVHRLSNARYLPLIRLHQPRCRLVFSVADLSHLRLARQAAVEDRPELARHGLQLRVAEFGAARFADAVITHSTHEAALLRAEVPAAKVHVVPWAVPPRPTAVPFARRAGLAFVGGYGHSPNVDAALFLILEVMPLVWRTDPAITCTLVGSDMPERLRAVAGPGVVLAGHVPDLAAVFDAVRLTAAPMTYGAGVKGKVLDSLAAGVPCACSPVAAEGMELPGVLAALVGAAPEELADAILRLHRDAALNASAAAAGLDYVAAIHSDAAVDAAMRRAAGTGDAAPA